MQLSSSDQNHHQGYGVVFARLSKDKIGLQMPTNFQNNKNKQYRVYKKNATSEFLKKPILFLSTKDFSPLGI